jgi:glycosyltransferase involved in cell wall biosynthesis
MSVGFSAVIPVYNRAHLIERCVSSVRRQTHPATEIIVVDDGSTDGTADVVAMLPGVQLVRQPNGGAWSARTTGLRTATQPWVAFLDSDDLWDEDHLERIAAAIEGTNGIAALYFDDTIRGESEGGGSHRSNAGLVVDDRWQLVEDGLRWMLMPLQPVMLQASVVSRPAALEIDGFRPRAPRDDTDFFLRLGIGRPVCAVDGVGTRMTDDADVRLGDRGHRKTDRYWRSTIDMYAELLDNQALDDEGREVVSRRLATAHLRLAASSIRGRRLRDGLRHGWRSLRTDPGASGSAISLAVRTRLPGRRA